MAARITHGQTRTPLYKHHKLILQRCHNPSCPYYPNYGGRGIVVCERWHDYSKFMEDMLPRPPGMVVARRDLNGPYSPENCFWAKREQSGAGFVFQVHTYKNMTMTYAEWSHRGLVRPDQFIARLRNGWDFEAALTTPTLRRTK